MHGIRHSILSAIQIRLMGMFERFSNSAIKVIMLAQEESRRLGHNFVGTEQILLGLIGERFGVAGDVLNSIGVTLKSARVEVEKVIGRGSGFVAVEIPFTPHAKRVLELASEVALHLQVKYIDTEHILLGVLTHPDGRAQQVLQALNVDTTELANSVLLLGKEGVPGRKFLVTIRPAMSQVSSLAVAITTTAQVLSNFHETLTKIDDGLGSNEPKPEILQDPIVNDALLKLLEELAKLDQLLTDYPSRLHEQINALQAVVRSLTQRLPDSQNMPNE